MNRKSRKHCVRLTEALDCCFDLCEDRTSDTKMQNPKLDHRATGPPRLKTLPN